MAKKRKKNPTAKNSPHVGKSPKIGQYPLKQNQETPVWQFCCLDNDGDWKLDADTFWSDVLPHLQSREKMTWNTIISQSGGKKFGTNNHPVPVGKLIRKAQKRLQQLKLDDREELFSFRLGGKPRLFGIREGRVFKMLWYDEKHEICPSQRK